MSVLYPVLVAVQAEITYPTPWKPPCDRNMFVLQQQQIIGQRFGTSKCIIATPPVTKVADGSLLLIRC